MNDGQRLAAFIAALLLEGMTARGIESAITRVEMLVVGDSISDGNPLFRAFAFEQAKRLENI